MSKLKFYLLSFTWGLPMTLIGMLAAIVLIVAGKRPKKYGYCWHFEVGNKWGGLDLGIVFITDKTPSTHTKNHEHGHALQNCYLGFLTPFVISIPSAIRYWYRKYLVKSGTTTYTKLPNYDNAWFESDATKRGTKFIDSLEENNIRYFEVVKDEFRKNLDVSIKLPTRGSEYSSGYDFYSPVDAVIMPNESILIWSDVRAYMYDDNTLILATRSSMGKQPVTIAQAIAIIDSDYYDNESTGGNIGIRLFNAGKTPYEIHIGDRIAQGIFMKYLTVKDDHTTTKRTGGFGSSGK